MQDLRERTKQFAMRIIRLYAALPKGNEVARVIGRQILRSGTSIGAHYREASRGRSGAEFHSKIGVALQELDETACWLELLAETGIVPATRLDGLLQETDELGPGHMTCPVFGKKNLHIQGLIVKREKSSPPSA